jgi:hypothetical protein
LHRPIEIRFPGHWLTGSQIRAKEGHSRERRCETERKSHRDASCLITENNFEEMWLENLLCDPFERSGSFILEFRVTTPPIMVIYSW